MARLRTLKPEFFTHEVLGELSPLHRLLFAGLWCYADREGRLEDRPKYLKTVLLPYDDCDVDGLLGDLASRGFVVRYEVGSRRLLAIPSFAKHQMPHHREKPSTLPPPPEAIPEQAPAVPVPAQGQPRAEPGQSTAEPVPSPSVFGLGESVFGLGDVGDGASAHVPGPAPVADEAALIPQAVAVFEHWARAVGQPSAVFSLKRRTAVMGRLREGSAPERMMLAVDGCLASPWHREKGVVDIAHICADASRVDDFVRRATSPPRPEVAPKRKGPTRAQDVDWTQQEDRDAPF